MKMSIFDMERMQSTWENVVDIDLAEFALFQKLFTGPR